MNAGFDTRVHLSLTWDDIQFVLCVASILIPNQRMFITSGVMIYEDMAAGVTAKGVKWHNNHIMHRENCMQTIKERALPWLIGKGVDVGCGLEKITPDCIGIDNGDDFREHSDADVIGDITDLTRYADGQFDWLFSSNSIEHLVKWEDALTEWVRVVRPGGIIYLYTPWPERCSFLRAGGDVKSHLWNPSPAILGNALINRGVEIVECDDDVDVYGTFVIVGRKK